MKLPVLNETNKSNAGVSAFRGYNHNFFIDDSEFYDEKNLSSDFYPLCSTRKKRGVFASPANVTGMISKDTLLYTDGTDVVFNGHRYDLGLSYEEKNLISMGAYVVIMPDKKYFNTADVSDYGNIEATYTSTDTVTLSISNIDGDEISISYISSEEPENPQNMEYWFDTSSNTVKQYSESDGMWVTVVTTYVKISSTNIGSAFSQYDGVTISGIVGSDIQNLNASSVIWSKGDDFIVVVGLITDVRTQTEPVTVSRKMPNMDFIIENDNRLWGCRYGTSADGSVVNELYACKLGDFKNWNCFMGISTDSYSVSLGSDGVFTGAITHMGYPCFFKENCLHKVYGNYPSNYQVQTTALSGVQKGCSKSLAIVNATLFYKAQSGICYYDGSLPKSISTEFGEEQYSDAVAGSCGNKYYVSMRDNAGTFNNFVYDVTNGIWNKEANFEAKMFCTCRGELYYVSDGKIYSTDPAAIMEEKIDWYFVTGLLGISVKGRYSTSPNPMKKYISKLNVRMSMAVGAKADFYIEYDSCGKWEHLNTIRASSLNSFNVLVRPRRCDHFRIKAVGDDEMKLFSIVQTLEQGSDM